MKSIKKVTAVIDIFQCVSSRKQDLQCVFDLIFNIKSTFDRASLNMIRQVNIEIQREMT